MVSVEPPAPTLIDTRLAARGVRPRKVSAKRFWPPGCGRFPAAPSAPEAGEGEKAATDGVVEGRAEDARGHTGVSPAASNSGLPHAPPVPKAGDGEKAAADGVVEGRAEDARGHTGVSPAASNGGLLHAPPISEAGNGEKAAADGVVEGRVENAPGHTGVSPAACNGGLLAPLAPEACGGEKAVAHGVVVGREEYVPDHTGVSPEACNSGLLHAPLRSETERVVEEGKERKEAQPQGDGVSDVQGEIRAIEAVPLAYSVPQSFAAAANGVMENGGYVADSLPVEGQGGQGSGQNGDDRAIGSSMVDGELERKEDGHDGGRKKRWLTSVVNLPPKRRAVSAIRKYPPGCGRTAVNRTSSGDEEGLVLEATPISFARMGATDAAPTVPVSGCGASLVSRKDAANEEVEGRRVKVEGANAHNTNQETQVAPTVPISGRGASLVFRKDAANEEVEGRRVKVEGAGLVLEATPISFARMGATDAAPTAPISGCGASLVSRKGAANEEVEGRRVKVEGANMAHNTNQETQVAPTVPISGCGASLVFRKDAANEEVEGRRVKVEGANKAHNTNQETQVVNVVVPDDFAGSLHNSARPRNVTKDSPKCGFTEKMKGKTPLHEGKYGSLVAPDGQMTSKGEGSSREGTPKTHVSGLVNLKTKGKRLECVKMKVTSLDDVGASGEGTMGNKALSTKRGVVHSNINTKQDIDARKFKRDAIGNYSLSRYPKDSKCESHVVADQIAKSDHLDLVTHRLIVQALMAPDKCPWAQGKKSMASVSRSLTPRSKLKKKVATPRKASPPKLALPTSAMHETIKDKENSSSEDDDDSLSLALVVKERKNELCVTLPPCAPFGDQSGDERSRVRKLLKLFQLICRKLMQAEEQHIRNVGRIDIEAVNAIKNGYPGYTKYGPIVGNVPGVEVGDEFHFRVELSIVGIHRPYQGGIDTAKVNGIPIATSIITSQNHDNLSSSDVLIYTGSGGKAIGNKEAEDQKLKGGNLGLKNCIETKTPVRVTHGFKGQNRGEVGHSKSKQISTYTYDGLYLVEECWQQGEKGSMVFKYKLRRIPGQPELALHIVRETKKSKVRHGLCLPDISQGKESIPVCVINTIDDMRPEPFKYITQVIYPSSHAKELPQGCDCTNGCSDSNKCACAVKNGGEIPFNFNGAIVQAKPLIYECGPSCRCPPTCHNRVSQHGVKIPLEIFKAGKTGWGVRSLSSISSGSFICEYAGELLQDTEAEKTENDEYLFDIGHNYDDEELWKGLPAMIPGLESSNSETMEGAVGLTIDAAKCGNVGRFINHSCSPNLYAQNVLWDHDDKRMPHIMFFAAENISPLQELTYHYNYTIGQVRDKNNEEKKKICLCGASDCCGRLY